MTAWLATGKPMDADVNEAYNSVRFCRDFWHCKPSEYRQERLKDRNDHMAVLRGENLARRR